MGTSYLPLHLSYTDNQALKHNLVLFGRDRTVIMRHIRNIFKEGELDENITCAKFTHVGTDQDQTYETKMYILDVIISVGYTVKSII